MNMNYTLCVIYLNYISLDNVLDNTDYHCGRMLKTS